MEQPENEKASPSRTGTRGPEYNAEDVRGGRIILRTRLQRIIFIAGLAGLVVLAILIRMFA